MGQKINPNILRIGKIKEWKSKYVEKKSTEFSTVLFRDLEIKKFIFQLQINRITSDKFRQLTRENMRDFQKNFA